MADTFERTQDAARIALASIRLVNGLAALFTPKFLIRRLGVNPKLNTAAIYAFRLFGIRTILIGAELLMPNKEIRDRSIRQGVIIHSSDTLTAMIAGFRKQLPLGAAIMATIISSINTLLAIIAWPRPQEAVSSNETPKEARFRRLASLSRR